MGNILDHTLLYEKYFEEICQIPHGSYHEMKLSNYLVEFAVQLGLRYKQYENGCVIIYKDGSDGCRDHAPVMLQGHMDMVCQKAPGCAHDFEKDPLDLYVENGLIRARGTTLGADDGVGVAYMMAILASDTLKHPPLECVFTVEEEVGCTGVEALRAEDLQSRRMIGLDDISGGSTTICAAGSAILEYSFNGKQGSGTGSAYAMRIDGLLGGHSGDQIHLERANAAKIAVRILYELVLQGVDIRIGAFQGGSACNSILRDCTVLFSTDLTVEQLEARTAGMIRALQEEYEYSDPGLKAAFEEREPFTVYDEKDSQSLLEYLYLVPDGLLHRSMHLTGLTTASSNLGILKTENGRMQITFMCRGAVDSLIDAIVNQIRLLSGLYGWEKVSTGRAPCWQYREGSQLRETLSRVFAEVTGRTLVPIAEHGGLECGAICNLRPEMDIVTLGPKVVGYHTSEEYLDRNSFSEIYRVLTTVLEQL